MALDDGYEAAPTSPMFAAALATPSLFSFQVSDCAFGGPGPGVSYTLGAATGDAGTTTTLLPPSAAAGPPTSACDDMREAESVEGRDRKSVV